MNKWKGNRQLKKMEQRAQSWQSLQRAEPEIGAFS